MLTEDVAAQIAHSQEEKLQMGNFAETHLPILMLETAILLIPILEEKQLAQLVVLPSHNNQLRGAIK